MQLSPELAQIIQEEQPALWIEWNISTGRWWHDFQRSTAVLGALGAYFP